MDRRRFVKVGGCFVALAAAKRLPARAEAEATACERARLVTAPGEPLAASALEKGTNYIFHYPFTGTPCFLLDLGFPAEAGVVLETARGEQYLWPGGVGPDGSIVAFSAICAHQVTRPSRAYSFINFNPAAGKIAEAENRITCCAHGSVYDPARGAEVTAGPAPQPLAAIVLEYRAEDDALFAAGLLGGDMFADFFKAYKRELNEEFGRGAAKQPVTGEAAVAPLAKYTRQLVMC
jgi:Rieske Fe-S protein